MWELGIVSPLRSCGVRGGAGGVRRAWAFLFLSLSLSRCLSLSLSLSLRLMHKHPETVAVSYGHDDFRNSPVNKPG